MPTVNHRNSHGLQRCFSLYRLHGDWVVTSVAFWAIQVLNRQEFAKAACPALLWGYQRVSVIACDGWASAVVEPSAHGAAGSRYLGESESGGEFLVRTSAPGAPYSSPEPCAELAIKRSY